MKIAILCLVIAAALVILWKQISFIIKYRKTMVPDSPKQQNKNMLAVILVVAIGGFGAYLAKHTDALPEIGTAGKTLFALLIGALGLYRAKKELNKKK